MTVTTNVFRRLRDRTGLSQSEFALKMGIELKTWQNWEQGVNQPHRLAFDTVIAKAKKIRCKKR